MPEANDMDLLQEFARTNSEAAFTELVRRHINLVYSVARRCTGSDGDAHDVAQVVFNILARKADSLARPTVLPGWLYETTRFTAARLLRANARRHAREQEAYMQSTLNEADTAAVWTQLAPHLETAMGELSERDRALLVLRFYENKTAAQTAELLGIGEEAAHKRAARALEKLRKIFARRGLAFSAGAIAGAVAASSVQAAPVGLAAIISSTALSGTTITTAVVAATKTIAMTTLQKIAITAALAAAIGAGIYEAKQAHDARNETARLQAQQAPMQEQLQRLQNSFGEATNRLGNSLAENAQLKSNPQEAELLKLRGQVGVLQAKASQSQKLNDSLLGSAKNGMGEMLKSSFTASLDRVYAKLFTDLNLTPEQVSKLKQLITDKRLAGTTEKTALFAGRTTPDQAQQLNDQIDKEKIGFDEQIKQLLGPDGFATYQAYEKTYNERSQIVGPMGFSDHLTDGTELTSSQTEQLIQAMADERQQFKFTVDLSNPGKLGGATATMYSDANVNQYLAEIEQLNQLYLARAQTILTPDQQTIFQKFLSNQIAHQKTVLNMSAKIIGAQFGKK